MLRLGIIGAGGIASLHTHNILSGKCPEVQLTAMADRKESRREWIRATVRKAGGRVHLAGAGHDRGGG